MRHGGWLALPGKTPCHRRKEEHEQQALLSWAGLSESFSWNILCLDGMRAFLSFCLCLFVSVSSSEGRKEARASFRRVLRLRLFNALILFIARCGEKSCIVSAFSFL